MASAYVALYDTGQVDQGIRDLEVMIGGRTGA